MLTVHITWRNKVTMEAPQIGSTFSKHEFTIEVIHEDDKRNKDLNGNYIKEPYGNSILYVYLSDPVGKIGECKTVDGFNATWR